MDILTVAARNGSRDVSVQRLFLEFCQQFDEWSGAL